MRLLITGTGRCGTRFLAKAITQAGVPCSHEVAFTPDRHGFRDGEVAEASWLAAPFVQPRDVYVVHVVRNPLSQIRSRRDKGTFAVRRSGGEFGPWGEFALKWCPQMRDAGTNTVRSAQHWVWWNRLVEADERIRLEDLTVEDVNRWAQVVDSSALGLYSLPPRDNVSEDPGPPFRLEHAARIPGLVELAERYGYDLTSSGDSGTVRA